MNLLSKVTISLILYLFIFHLGFSQARYCYESISGGFFNNEFVCGLYEDRDFRGCPAFTDIDGDGDQDLFFGRNRRITFYRNEGDSLSPCWQFITDFYDGIELPFLGVSPAFGDVNNDGKVDLFVGYGQGGGNGGVVRLYLQEELNGEPHFVMVEDSLGNVDVGDNAKVTCGDFDNDNDLDLVIGGGFGHVVYLQNIGDSLQYNYDTTAIEIRDVGWQAKPQAVDIDCDGILELFVRNSYGSTFFWDNESGNTNHIDNWIEQTTDYGNFNAVYSTLGFAFTDIDADGTQDLFSLGSNQTFAFYRNNGTKYDTLWQLETPYYHQISGGSISAFANIDQDAPLELIIGSTNLIAYDNIGTYEQPHWVFLSDDFANVSQGGTKSPTFFDYDEDGDQDLWFGTSSLGKVFFYENVEGEYVYTPDVILESFDFGGFAHPIIIDIDFNDTLDLFVLGSEGFHHFINLNNSNQTPFWDLQTTNYIVDLNSQARKPTFGDLDNDGDFDLLISAPSKLLFYRNISNTNAPIFVLETEHFADLPGGFPTLVDLTSDCGLELSLNGGTLYRFCGINPSIVPLEDNVLCSSDSPIALESFPIDKVDGMWGDNSPLGVFDPSIGGGSYPIYYCYTDPFSCITLCDTSAIFVVDAPEIPICSFDTINLTDEPIELTCDFQGDEIFSGPGVMDNIFDPSLVNPGVHDILYTVIDENGCMDSMIITLDISVNAFEEQKEMEVKVFPNPVREFIYIWSAIDDTLFNIYLYNFQGKLLHKEHFVNLYTGEGFKLPVDQYIPGTYLIKIENEIYNETRKIVIQ